MLLLLSYIGETDASLQFDSRFHSISLTFLFDLSHASLRFVLFYSAIELKQSFDFTEMASPQR